MKWNLEQAVREALQSAILQYLNAKKEPDSEHVVLDRIFPVERRIRSIIGGLETSLGTTLWEKIAKEIARANNFEILDAKAFRMPSPVPIELTQVIGAWKVKREKAGTNVSLDGFIAEVREKIPSIKTDMLEYIRLTKGRGIDLWLLRDGIEYAFDIKTVQINAGSGLAFNSTLLEWYAFRLLRNPSANFEARYVIPYCPFKPPIPATWWARMGGRAYPLQPQKDVLVQDEFWDFLSGTTHTWQSIVAVFDELGRQGFGKQFDRLFYPKTP